MRCGMYSAAQQIQRNTGREWRSAGEKDAAWLVQFATVSRGVGQHSAAQCDTVSHSVREEPGLDPDR